MTAECEKCGGIPLHHTAGIVHEDWCPLLSSEEREQRAAGKVEAFVRGAADRRGRPL